MDVVIDRIFDVETWGTGNDGRDDCSCLLLLFPFFFNSRRKTGSPWIRSIRSTQHTNGYEWNGNGKERDCHGALGSFVDRSIKQFEIYVIHFRGHMPFVHHATVDVFNMMFVCPDVDNFGMVSYEDEAITSCPFAR